MKKDNGAVFELEEYRKQDANILCPTTKIEGLSDWHQAVIDSVTLSAKPDCGDVYVHTEADEKKGKDATFILTGQALNKLAVCAGVYWMPTETRATAQTAGYVAYRAVGCMRKPDGTPVCFQAEYDLDMEVIEDEIRQGYDLKVAKFWTNAKWWKEMPEDRKKDYLESCIRKDILFKRKHKTKLAATGAKNRVIRALLGIKKTYTAGELSKPFVMPRVTIQPPMDDPDVKRAFIAASVQALTGIYGPTPMPATNEDVADIIDIQPVGSGPTDDDEPIDPDTAPPDSDPGPDDSDRIPHFDDMDAVAQGEVLSLLAARKGYPTDIITPQEQKEGVMGITRQFHLMNTKSRKWWFDYLNGLDEDDDSIPF